MARTTSQPGPFAASLWDIPVAVPPSLAQVTEKLPTPARKRATRAAAEAEREMPAARPSHTLEDRAALVWGAWPGPDDRLGLAGDAEGRVWAYSGHVEYGAERACVELVAYDRRADTHAPRATVDYQLVR